MQLQPSGGHRLLYPYQHQLGRLRFTFDALYPIIKPGGRQTVLIRIRLC